MISQYKTLPNGVRVVHQAVDSKVAHFGIIINAGSRDEEPHEQGIAHFIEHTFFKGTQNRKAFQVSNRIEDVGGELNAYTTKEETSIYTTFLSDYFERSIELMSDIFINSTFPEHELEREKEVVLEEINSYNDSPAELIFDDFEELIFDGHAIARNILGTPETVRSFTREHILRFIQRCYTTDQIVLASVGNIDSEKVFSLVEKYFGGLEASTRSFVRDDFHAKPAVSKQHEKDTYQAHCLLGSPSFSITDSKRTTMVLLNNILGGSSMNSRLNRALRERNGLAYNIESGYTPYTDTGIFSVYFGTEENNIKRALRLIEREFKLLREKPLGKQQLQRAKNQLIGQIAIANENPEELMFAIGRSLLLYNKVDDLDSVFRKIETITAEQLQELAQEVLHINQMSKLIYL